MNEELNLDVIAMLIRFGADQQVRHPQSGGNILHFAAEYSNDSSVMDMLF